MTDVVAVLKEAFENEGFTVASASVNRDSVRVAVLDDDADRESLRAVVTDAVDDPDAVERFGVTTEAIDGRDRVGTVVSFRYVQ